MFVCDDCLVANYDNERSMLRSRGKCEVCGYVASCNDIPSRYLLPKRVTVKVLLHGREQCVASVLPGTMLEEATDALLAKVPDLDKEPLVATVGDGYIDFAYDGKEYFVHRNPGGAVFVKEGQFFRDQGGETEEWGKAWTRVVASGIEHARVIGENTLPKR